MSNEWYLREDGETFGPYPKSQLVALARAGRLSPASKVHDGEDGTWQRAGDIPGLFKAPDAPIGSKATSKGRRRPAASRESSSKLIVIASLGGLVGAIFIGACVWLASGAIRPDAPIEPISTTVAESDAVSNETAVVDDSSPTAGVANVASTPSPAEETDPSTVSVPSSSAEAPTNADSIVASEENDDGSETGQSTSIDDDPILPLLVADEDETEFDVADTETQPAEVKIRTDSQVTEFLKRIKLQRKAKDAYSQLTSFTKRYDFTEAQRVRLSVELAEWKKRSDSNQCRLGSKWVVERELLAAEDAAFQLTRDAARKLEALEFEEGIKLLREASQTNPNGLRADYTLGLLYSLPFAGVKAPETAERHFRRVLTRSPDHPAALNSLAIAQVKQREYGPAYTNFSRAAALSPNDQEVIQNTGRFLMLADFKRLPTPSDNVVRRFRRLYETLTSSDGSPEFDARTGWLHMLPVFPSEEVEDQTDKDSKKPRVPQSDLVPLFGGTGFVVAPGYVLTNRHVVEDDKFGLGIAQEIRTIDPGDPAHRREIGGTVVAVSDDEDLALVQYADLKAPTIGIDSNSIDLASDVLILGYPQTNVLGTGLKTTRGIVSALPDTSRSVVPDYVLFDASADHGNSGGPVVNRTGNVVAVLTVVVNTGSGLSGGVTANAALNFLKQHLPQFTPGSVSADPDDHNGDWASITKTLSPSVLQLTSCYEAGVPEINIAANRSRASGNVYEDRTCPWCNGRSRVKCMNRDCVSGRISVPYYVEEVVGAGNLRQVISHKRVRKERCPTCGGAGHVDCNGCSNGLDSSLR